MKNKGARSVKNVKTKINDDLAMRLQQMEEEEEKSRPKTNSRKNKSVPRSFIIVESRRRAV